MSRFVERTGDSVARELRRVWDNLFVLWLGSVLGAWSARLGIVWQWLASALLFVAAAGFVRWWELRRLKRQFLAAVETGQGGLTVLPGPGAGGEQQ